MATLADSFLEDLDDLESDEEGLEESNIKASIDEAASSQSDEDDENDEKELIMDDTDLVKLVEAKVSSGIGILRHSHRYKKILDDVRSILQSDSSSQYHSTSIEGVLEHDPEYRLVLSCNKLAQDIDDEIVGTYKYVSQLYSKKFPELEGLVTNKLDYIKLVNRIGNEMDLTLIKMNDLIPPPLVMIVSVSASTTLGTPLKEQEIQDVYKACEEILCLDEDKAVVLQFVASRMNRIAPNLCNLIGARIAAQIVGLAGGVIALSKIPSCNIQVMGQEKRHLAGLSTAATMRHAGVLLSCDIVQRAPPAYRRKVMKIVSAKVALLARVDSYKNHPDGSEGLRFRKLVEEKFEKMMAPAAARTKKALPIPEEKKKSRRGGRRIRKLKERYAMTELRQQQNRISFSTDVGEYGDSAMGMDKGMVGFKDSGKVRVTQKKEVKFTSSKKMKKALSMSSGATNGLSSSLVFTPVQGLELVNPNAAAERVREANNKWFNNQSGFLSAAPK